MAGSKRKATEQFPLSSVKTRSASKAGLEQAPSAAPKPKKQKPSRANDLPQRIGNATSRAHAADILNASTKAHIIEYSESSGHPLLEKKLKKELVKDVLDWMYPTDVGNEQPEEENTAEAAVAPDAAAPSLAVQPAMTIYELSPGVVAPPDQRSEEKDAEQTGQSPATNIPHGDPWVPPQYLLQKQKDQEESRGLVDFCRTHGLLSRPGVENNDPDADPKGILITKPSHEPFVARSMENYGRKGWFGSERNLRISLLARGITANGEIEKKVKRLFEYELSGAAFYSDDLLLWIIDEAKRRLGTVKPEDQGDLGQTSISKQITGGHDQSHHPTTQQVNPPARTLSQAPQSAWGQYFGVHQKELTQPNPVGRNDDEMESAGAANTEVTDPEATLETTGAPEDAGRTAEDDNVEDSAFERDWQELQNLLSED